MPNLYSSLENDMNVLKQLEKHLEQGQADEANPIFERLIRALCLQEKFDLAELYELNYEDYELALDVLKAWRLGRYTKTKDRLQQMYKLSEAA